MVVFKQARIGGLFSKVVCLVAVLVTGEVCAQTNYTPYTFTTLAGLIATGSADGTNDSARFASPQGITIDAATNLYVADYYTHLIRKISPSGTNWVVSTLAGQPGSFGTNDGQTDVARFWFPRGITIGTNGVIYVAQSGFGSVRQIAFSGSNWLVSTLVTQLVQPAGIAIDGASNLYVTESIYNDVQKISPSGTNWVVNLFAGSPFPIGDFADGTTGFFNFPWGVAVDTNGNVFTADSGNHALRRTTPSRNTSTPAGTGRSAGSADGTNNVARFNGPQGVTIDRSNNIYVADTLNHTIRKVTPTVISGSTKYVVTTIAGSALIAGSQEGTNNVARFAQPNSLAVDNGGTIYVTDTVNSTLRRITLNGTNWVVSTIAGLPGSTGDSDGPVATSRFYQPGAMTMDKAGNAYIADTRNHTIRRITKEGRVTTLAGVASVSGTNDGVGSAARFNRPGGIAVDMAGNVFVADTRNQTIRRLSAIGTNWQVTTIAGSVTNIGTFVDGTNSVARFSFPAGLAVDGTGRIFVADGSHTIRMIVQDGTNWVVTTPVGKSFNSGTADGTNDTARFNTPNALAIDSVGTLFAADSRNCSIRMIVPDGTNWIVTTPAGLGGFFGAVDGTNGDARFNFPMSVAVDGNGVLFVADSSNHTIRRIVRGGTNWVVTTVSGVPGFVGGADGTGDSTRFFNPSAIAVDADGNLYVADTYNNAIRKGWPVGTPPVIKLDQPTIASGQVQFNFIVASGVATNFSLLSAADLAGPWTTNTAAVLTPMVPGISYHFSFPQSGAAQFYRVQTP